jgi:predicted amidohydrolase YtcJ
MKYRERSKCKLLSIITLTIVVWTSSCTRTNHFRIGGAKLNLDGSPQGKTAWLTKPYQVPPEGQNPDYKGNPAVTDNEAIALN